MIGTLWSKHGGFVDVLLDFFLIRVPVRFRKRVIENAGHQVVVDKKRALLYYKTDPFFSKRLVKKGRHTNDREIVSMVSSLTEAGFIVDVIDREASRSQIFKLRKYEYELFFSNCAGNSAPLHWTVVDDLKPKKIVALAMGPDPELSVKNNVARHANFRDRTGVDPVLRRMVDGSPEEWSARFGNSSAIFINARPGTFSYQSYLGYEVPLHFLPSAVSDSVPVHEAKVSERSPKTFMFFGGNGLICKGLDLVLEAFDGLHHLDLHVFAPPGEKDFWSHYRPLLARNPQIHFHGFVDVGGRIFQSISQRAAFNIFPASAEGCATSVTSAMRSGVIPVVTHEAGLDVEGYGIQIGTIHPEPAELRDLVCSLSELSESEVNRRSRESYLASLDFTDLNFRKSFQDAVLQIIL